MKNIMASLRVSMIDRRGWTVGVAIIGIALFLSACGGSPNVSLSPFGSNQPIVDQIEPTSGTVAGGTPVVILGQNFENNASVTIGGQPATNVSFIGPLELTAMTPKANATGMVDVVVSNPGGGSGTLHNGFTYVSPPVITAISPTKGSILGGATVTITGIGFLSSATVSFGNVPGTNVIVSANGDTITVTSPPHAAGTVVVTVNNGGGASATIDFIYGLPPTVTSIVPPAGPTSGGTPVTITGTEFQPGATVTIGGAAATNVNVSATATSLTAVTPLHAAGAADVKVTNPDGNAATLASGFTYQLITVTITSVTPPTGLPGGGTPVTIIGTNFEQNAVVMFDGIPATTVVVDPTGTKITCFAPAGPAGTAVDVTVINPDNSTVTAAKAFTYSGVALTITNVSPPSGTTAGGTAVTITGTGFNTTPGTTTILTFGGTNATSVTVVSSTQITAVTPAQAAGPADVTIINPDTSTFTLSGGYTYTASSGLTIASITPGSGTTAGGTMVTIIGSGFQSGLTVEFGTTPGTNVAVPDPTQITVTTPAATAAGQVNVTVINPAPGGQSVTSPGPNAGTTNGFNYTNPAPTITTISPTFGSTAGGTSVTINGTGFISLPTVTFGGVASPSVVFVNSTQLTATTPAESASTINVVVTNPDNQSATSPVQFTFGVTAVQVLTTTTPDGNPTAPYYATLQAAGGTPPYTWSIASGSLPPGLSLNATTGVVSGVPTTTGVSNFTAQATDSLSATGTAGLAISVELPTVAVLPSTFLDTTFPDTSKYTPIPVPDGGNLQAAINTAAVGCATVGQLILLHSGSTYSRTFKLPQTSCAPGQWIIIQTDPKTLPPSTTLPPQGTRIDPSYSPVLAKILSDANAVSPITALSNASHFWFMGLEIGVTSSVTLNYGIFNVGNGENDPSLLADHIYVDRCYIHGNATGNIQRGFQMNGASLALVDSYVENVHFVGTDSQAAAAWNSPGPLKIVNNFLSASSEIVLFGGAGVDIPNVVPSDIEIRRNHFFKPTSWFNCNPAKSAHCPGDYAGIGWEVKNWLEFKDAQRVLVEGNVFENNWANAQAGIGVLFTPRNQKNGLKGANFTVADVTFRYNFINHEAGGFAISGEDGASPPTLTTQRLNIHDNLFLDLNSDPWGGNGFMMVITNSATGLLPPDSVTFDHNTGFQSATTIDTGDNAGTNLINNFIFTNNILPFNTFVVVGAGTTPNGASLDAYFLNSILTNNVFVSPPPTFKPLPPGNFFPADFSPANLGFVNFAGEDFRLCTAALCNGSTSPYAGQGILPSGVPDREDIGADVSAINAVTAGVK